MNLTIDILQQVADPKRSSHLSSASARRLVNYSLKNRFLMLYLDATKHSEALKGFRQTYTNLVSENAEALGAVARISRILSDANVDHVVFKTVRPYIFTTVDIDIIVFGTNNDFWRANAAVKKAGYEKIVEGPQSTTFRDPTTKMGVDLYREIAVSNVPYVDKAKLSSYVIHTEMPNGDIVRMLACEADLLCIIAHSLIKENLYVISEYYSCIHYLEHLDVNSFLQLAHDTHLTRATMIHMTITALLHKVAHNTLPSKLRQILSTIGLEALESSRIMRSDYTFPHRYHPTTIARCLTDIIREKKTRRGIVNQVLHSWDRHFLNDFTRRLLNHMTRETY